MVLDGGCMFQSNYYHGYMDNLLLLCFAQIGGKSQTVTWIKGIEIVARNDPTNFHEISGNNVK